MASGYVFISYSRQDREFVRQLSAGLRGTGIKTWTDLENISQAKSGRKRSKKGCFRQVRLSMSRVSTRSTPSG